MGAELREQSGDAGAGATALTQRERQIVRLVCEGLSNKEVGQRLNITDGTIKVHLHKIFEKLRVSNRTALVAVYLSSPDNHGPQDQAREQPDHDDLGWN